LDGSSQSIIWGATGRRSGGAFGSNWSLTESGNSFDSPWTFNNEGQGITSLVIDAIPGNTVFDNIRKEEVTPYSADGWGFETLSVQSPDFFAYSDPPDFFTYSDPIDISKGDLFGRLSLYWTNGFAGKMEFRADTDSGSKSNPVQPRDPVVRDAAPTVSFSLPTIYEGKSASTSVSATDPGDDAITFFLNGGNLGTDFTRSGTRSVGTNLGFFADNGEYTYTAQARDENGNYSNPVTSTLKVLNVAPTVTGLRIPTIYEGNWASAYISATDPGADSISFFLNDKNVGTDARKSGTRSKSVNLGYFADNGYIPYKGQAVDKDGGRSAPVNKGLTVLNLPPTLTEFNLSSDTIYQGQSVSASLYATDPGADSINFFVNGNFVGTDPNTSGIRSVGTNLGTFTDVGEYTFTGIAQDKDTAFSNALVRTLKVLNVAPTITQLTENLIVKQNELFDFAAAATDPGIHDLLSFDWDFNMDGIFDFTSSTGQWSFGEPGTYKVGLRVSDDKGGYTSSSFTVEVERVPEPGSALGILAFGAFSAGAVLRRKQQQIGKNNNLN
jgi:chitodextrinase